MRYSTVIPPFFIFPHYITVSFPLTTAFFHGMIAVWIKRYAPPRVPPRVKIEAFFMRGYDGIGRRVGFRFLCPRRVGSSPTIRTTIYLCLVSLKYNG